MEPDPRAAAGARRLRFLNGPARVSVHAGHGPGEPPLAVVLKGRKRTVEAVQEMWRVDEGWWRPRPVSRRYYRLVLDDGRQLTIYRDLGEQTWWTQRG